MNRSRPAAMLWGLVLGVSLLAFVTARIRAQDSALVVGCGSDFLDTAQQAARLGRVVWKIRTARVYALTQGQRLALAHLETHVLATLDAVPDSAARRFQYEWLEAQRLDGVQRHVERIYESHRPVEGMMHSNYSFHLEMARDDLWLICNGRQRWPALYAEALAAAAL